MEPFRHLYPFPLSSGDLQLYTNMLPVSVGTMCDLGTPGQRNKASRRELDSAAQEFAPAAGSARDELVHYAKNLERAGFDEIAISGSRLKARLKTRTTKEMSRTKPRNPRG